jgi:hypothetical protein
MWVKSKLSDGWEFTFEPDIEKDTASKEKIDFDTIAYSSPWRLWI